MEKINLTDHSPAAMKRGKRPFTTSIIIHRFAADVDNSGVTTFDEAIHFFTKSPAGIATISLRGSWSEIKPTIDRWERDGIPAAYQAKGFVPYHFLVNAQGEAARMLSLDVRGAHTAGWNARSVAVCCLGNFEMEIPTKEQIAGCAAVVADILRVYLPIYPGMEVVSHDECQRREGQAPKGCPGRHFPVELVAKTARQMLKSARA